jgi:hypothetical protein
MLQDGELVTEGNNLGREFCPVTEERPNDGGDDAEYRHVVLSEVLTTCSDGPREHTLDTRHKSIHTNADGIFRRHSVIVEVEWERDSEGAKNAVATS